MAAVLFYYSWSLLPFAFIRILNFNLFARNESGLFFRLALFLYSLNVGFDLVYVGLLRMGAKGIPLGLLSSLVITSCLAFRRNVSDLRTTADRVLRVFSVKVVVSALSSALVTWILRRQVTEPASARGDFVFLCLLCGVGTIVFVAGLVVTGALTRPFANLFSRRAEQPESTQSSIL
jgi:peptidoglycan biosynthesis protein MviN/MurJ (putative lipid II flippase)